MKNIYILNCAGDISTCCSDFGLARSLAIVKNLLNLIQIIIPLILLVMVTVQLIQMMSKPDEKKNFKKLVNKCLGAVIVFFLPTFVNVVLGIMPATYEFASCLEASEEVDQIIKASKSTYISVNDEKAQTIIDNPDDYDKGEKRKEPTNSSGSGSASASTGNGNILLVAGHTYPPYCSNFPNECRGKESSGYDETDQTRILVKLIKSELDGMGVKADIANALMSGDNNTMNKSMYTEILANSAAFKKYDWKKYKYGIEIHFNACDTHNASGTRVLLASGASALAIDQEIINAVSNVLGTNGKGLIYEQNTKASSYFKSIGVPYTYLETEFYDNKSAMDKYYNNKEKVAKAIASKIKQYYG